MVVGWGDEELAFRGKGLPHGDLPSLSMQGALHTITHSARGKAGIRQRWRMPVQYPVIVLVLCAEG